MACSGCSGRRQALGAAARAVRFGQAAAAGVQIKVATKSLSDDAKAFARGLKVRLIQR